MRPHAKNDHNIYGLHSEVPKGFQGSFGSYYAFAPRRRPRPTLTTVFTPTSVDILIEIPEYLRIRLFGSSHRSAL
jgi:hypothetical protein